MALLYIERSPRLTEHPNTQRYHDHGISKQRFQQQEGNKFLSLLHLGKSLKNQAGKLSFISQFGLQNLLSKLYFCGHKIRFATSKVTCRLLPQWSD